MKADARASELIEEIASLRKNNLNLQKEKKEVAELLAQSKMRGEESQKRCDQNEEKASESLQRLNKLHNEFSALERWERAKSLGTCNGYIYSSSSCLHRLIIKSTPFSLEWPQCFRPCYAAEFLLSNVRRNTVALQVAKELRGVTGHPGNLQRISIFLFRATLPKSNPEANFKRMSVISRHTMRADGTSTKLSPRCVCVIAFVLALLQAEEFDWNGTSAEGTCLFTLSLPWMINVKFPLLPQQMYYITHIANLAFDGLLRR